MMSWLRLGLPLVLLALCSQSACGHHSDHLCMRRSFWKELMLGLENINPVFSPECRVQYDVNLEVPAMLEPAGHHKAGVAVEMLKGIVRLFSESETPFPKKRRLMFLNRLTEILSHLQSCMESPHSHNIHRLAVQGRFQKLGAFLLEKGNSDCAWEIVHAVTRVILQKAARNHTRK